MKQKKLKSIVSCILIFTLIPSCSIQKEQQDELSQSAIVLRETTGYGTNWIQPANPNASCSKPAYNCLDVIVITPGNSIMRAAYEQLNEAVSGGADDVSNYFTNGPWEVIFPGLANENNEVLLNKLRSSNYRLDRVDGIVHFYYAINITTNEHEFIFQVEAEN